MTRVSPAKLKREALLRTNGEGPPMSAGDWRRHAEAWQRWYEQAARERSQHSRMITTLQKRLRRILEIAERPLTEEE